MTSIHAKYDEYASSENPATSARTSSILAALIGIAVGAALALLFAPQSGEELRGELMRRMDSARNRSGDLLNGVRGKVMPFRRRGGEA